MEWNFETREHEHECEGKRMELRETVVEQGLRLSCALALLCFGIYVVAKNGLSYSVGSNPHCTNPPNPRPITKPAYNVLMVDLTKVIEDAVAVLSGAETLRHPPCQSHCHGLRLLAVPMTRVRNLTLYA